MPFVGYIRTFELWTKQNIYFDFFFNVATLKVFETFYSQAGYIWEILYLKILKNTFLFIILKFFVPILFAGRNGVSKPFPVTCIFLYHIIIIIIVCYCTKKNVIDSHFLTYQRVLFPKHSN